MDKFMVPKAAATPAPPRATATDHDHGATAVVGSIERQYKKLTHIQQILLRPDTYVGSVKLQRERMAVWDAALGRITEREVEYVPALCKLFDELLVNAADNQHNDPTMTTIRVSLNADTGAITVFNDGVGVPVAWHKDAAMYVPQFIFGKLLTGSNFDDDTDKVTGGRNGYGAKLVNLFSTGFEIDVCDSVRHKAFRQTFTGNMSTWTEPEVHSSMNQGFTRLQFCPDYARLGLEGRGLTADHMALLAKRVYDLAGTSSTSIRVFLNNDEIRVRSFKQYVSLYDYIQPDDGVCVLRVNDRWEVAVAATPDRFRHVSFVNAICTDQGGPHVKYVLDQVTAHLASKASKRCKKAELVITKAKVQEHVAIFVNCLINNPSFNSQAKHQLNTPVADFGSTATLPSKFLTKVCKLGIIQQCIAAAKQKAFKHLRRIGGTRCTTVRGIPKLDDANLAGTKASKRCTLILTEGDSAKALAVSGLAVVGRDTFGVYPLKGKMMNVRKKCAKKIAANVEVQHLCKILGIKIGQVYTDVSALRYGRILIMADQDYDGSHIKGLILNLLAFFWPQLLCAVPNFVQQFITPIIKVTTKLGARAQSFFTMPDFERWWAAHAGARQGFRVKYYKGLGTSTAQEAREYFRNLGTHVVPFVCDQEGVQGLAMPFCKNSAPRKAWIMGLVPGTTIHYSPAGVTLTDFVGKELVIYANYSAERSIPALMDGLKTSQRKVLYSCFRRKLTQDIKVVQLGGYTSEHAAYHHGEESLHKTIIGMAQNYVYSNNVNLLVPSGMFGTRLAGGDDAASPRYIFTKLATVTRHLFHPADDPLLEYLQDEGEVAEPKWYAPAIPMCLVNGSVGIGTGFSSAIPQYNPRDLIDAMRAMLNGDPPPDLVPWSRGFKGTIEANGSGKGYWSKGLYALSGARLEITELPLGKWTQTYKQLLHKLMLPGRTHTALVATIKENHTDTSVHFVVELTGDGMQLASDPNPERHKEFLTTFQLRAPIHLTNMHMFNAQGVVSKYASIARILQEYFAVRLDLYGRRKAGLLQGLEEDLQRARSKLRFITEVNDGTLVLRGKRRSELVEELRRREFPPVDGGFQYLLSLPMWSLTLDAAEAQATKVESLKSQRDALAATDARGMWRNDLESLEAVLLAEGKAAVSKHGHTRKRRRGADVLIHE